MKTGAKLLLGGAALYLLSRTLGGRTATGPQMPGDGSLPASNSQNPNTIGVDPNTLAAQNTARNVDIGVKVGGAILTTGAGLVAALAKAGVLSAGSGTAAAAAAGGAAGGGTGSGAGAGGGTGVVVGTIAASPAAIAGGAAIVIIIAAAVASTLAAQAVQDMAKAAGQFVNSTVGPNAAFFLRQFLSNMTVNGVRPATMRDVSPDIIRKIVLTAMWLKYEPDKYRNDLLMTFYTNVGYPEGRRPLYSPTAGIEQSVGLQQAQPDYAAWWLSKSQWGYWGEQYTPQNSTAVSAFWNSLGLGSLEVGQLQLPASVTMPATPYDMQAAAVDVLGTQYSKIIATLNFNAAVSALALAGQQIWTQGNYPGDVRFTQDLQTSMLPSWQLVEGMFVNGEGRQAANIWLVDPVSGSRVAPASIRRHWQILPFVSIKGQMYSGTPNVPPGSLYGPGLPPGAYMMAGFSGHSGKGRRRFAGFGAPPPMYTTSQCVDFTTGQFVQCGSVEAGQLLARGAPKLDVPTNAASAKAQAIATELAQQQADDNARRYSSGGGVTALLPLLAVGGAALLLLGKKS